MDEKSELRALIAARILEAGPIPFSEFLELALYHPKLGYYVTNDPGLDYQSSPQVSDLFGSCLAVQIANFWSLLKRPPNFTIFEPGARDGCLALDVLTTLRAMEPALFESLTYTLHDPAAFSSSEHRVLADGDLGGKISIASSFPKANEIEGCILSNELLDALPFDRVRVRDGKIYELRTAFEQGLFQDVEAEPSETVLRQLSESVFRPAEGCAAEVGGLATAWMHQAGLALQRGYLLSLDYGYDAKELYAPWRKSGTLLTFYKQTSGEDPYARIGLQDITASVNLSAARQSSERAGLRTLGQTSQAAFLTSLGIGNAVTSGEQTSDLSRFYGRRRAALELTDLAGLGRIQVLIQGKDVPQELPMGLSLTA